MIDYSKYKHRIGDFLSRRVSVIQSGKDRKISCLQHDDSTPSAIIYRDRLWCPVCDESWDIYDVAGMLESESDRYRQYMIIEREFRDAQAETSTQERKKTEPAKPVALSYERAHEIFKRETFRRMGELMRLPTDHMTAYPYYNEKSEIDLIDVRYESENRKDVVSFYYDGKNVKAKNPPILVYGRNAIAENPEKPVLVVEGAKTAQIAQVEFPEYVVVTWNGGSKKAGHADWSILEGRDVLIYPDDDQTTDKNGSILPDETQPGIKAALAIREQLPDAKIIRPIAEARDLKKSGADIEEALQAVGPDFIREYFRSERNLWKPPAMESLTGENDEVEPAEHSNHDRIGYEPFPDAPFRVLGIADDGRAYFLNKATGRLYDFALDSLSPQKMMQIADLQYWTDHFEKPSRGKSNTVDWEMVYNAIIQESNRSEFIPENLRGRGAWREPDGRIAYHDGKDTVGQYADERVFIRKTRQSIGIDKTPLPEEQRNEIRKHIENASFESKLDAIRLLGWSALAPFAGALPWRPAAMLTAPPGSGKTTILTNVIKPLTKPVILNGGESTPAGIRQIVARDSTAILLDEIEDDTRKKKEIREEIFSMMRQSTSDEAPITAKGTADQKGVSYNMKNMFFFSAISNLIESKADDSRIFKINMTRSKDKLPSYWTSWNRTTREMLDDDSCDRLRAHTWANLTKILKDAQWISDIMQEITRRDSRQCYADSLLFSAYFTTWERPEATIEDFEQKVREILTDIFAGHVHDEADEADEEPEQAMERIMSHRILMPESRRELSVREGLYKLMYEYDGESSEKREVQESLMRYGIKIQHGTKVAIRIKHPDIGRITEKGAMYHKALQRHGSASEKNTVPVYYPGGTARAVVFDNIIKKEETKIGLMIGG